MGGGFLMLVLWMFYYFSAVSANGERDALMTFKSNLSDPDNVLTSWDSKDVNPCTWHLITCNNDNEVTEIHLGNANLSGHLVAQLGSLSNLIILELYNNNISGKIPPELGNLTSLERLELYQNNLSGPIPDELGKLSKLRIMELYNNNISGKMPPELGNLTSLERLELYHNNLSGPIPDELGKLEKLRIMRLYNNTLSGRIPMSLTTIVTLQVLDVANNNLSGIIPLNGSFSFFCPISFQHNPYLENALNIPYYTAERVEVGNSSTGAIAAGTAGATFLFGVFATALVWWRRRKDQNHFFDVSGEDDPETQLGELYWFYPRALHRFSLTDLQVATDNFDPKNIVGRGGFGQVYKGCLADGSLVAVKRLKDAHNKVEERQFQTEVEMISLVVHPNLLRLQGFCMTPTEKLLVYPFMANGSVASCLQGSQPLLDWPKRKQIALGSARGLAYLHHQFDPKVIHRDVKAANILLDDEFEAVVGDFGLVKLMGFEDSHLTTLVCGTIGHIAPEYLSHGKCSEKTDVFGYGVMLLELLSGQKATHLAKLAIDHGFMLHDWVRGLLKDEKLERLVDGNLRGDSNVEEEVEQLIQIALLSTHNSPEQRPTMCELVRMLQGDGLAKRWQKQEAFYQQSNYALLANRTWILDSTSKLRPDQLSGPR